MSFKLSILSFIFIFPPILFSTTPLFLEFFGFISLLTSFYKCTICGVCCLMTNTIWQQPQNLVTLEDSSVGVFLVWSIYIAIDYCQRRWQTEYIVANIQFNKMALSNTRFQRSHLRKKAHRNLTILTMILLKKSTTHS